MSVYSLDRVSLAPNQLECIHSPSYQTFSQRFSRDLDEWVTVFDEQAIEHAYLRLGSDVTDDELESYKSILLATCSNTDGEVYWTWVFYDIFHKVQLVTIGDLTDAYEECRANFSFIITITRETIRDEDREWLVNTFVQKVKEIRNRKLDEMCDAWVMDNVRYTNMVQWVPRELIEHLVYSVLKCST